MPPAAAPPDEALLPTGRFELRRKLGEGGYGRVYEAYDREREMEVALKHLTRVEPKALYRFKREFRAFADARHPNIVKLFELFSAGEQWFYTMELVRGGPWLAWVRREPDVRSVGTADTTLEGTLGEPDYARIRHTGRQVVSALVALHAVGGVHRDVKPSNVLVDASGRAVLLDFGISQAPADDSGQTDGNEVRGTPAYMSPEQFSGEAPRPPADLYAFGVMLFEAITGRLPFAGTILQVLTQKQRSTPPRVADLVPSCPPGLATLCDELLARDPEARPSGEEVYARLGETGTFESGELPGFAAPPVDRDPLIGRGAETERLLALYAKVRAGAAVTVLVRGGAGSGKTALCKAFLDRLGPEAVVFEGRCQEREAVPFKALDAVVDRISRYLRGLPEPDVAKVTPRDAAALTLLFPVLQRLPSFAAAPRQVTRLDDRVAVRNRGLVALRELFARMADRHPLVVFVDDVQWGDADSARAIDEIFEAGDAPAMMLLLACRSEDEAESPLLAALRERACEPDEILDVPPLADGEAEALAWRLLGNTTDGHQVARAIAREAGGSPFLVEELARQGGGEGRSDEDGFERVLRARLRDLSEGAERVLRVASASTRGASWELLSAVAHVEGTDLREAIEELRLHRLVRVAGAAAERLEPYHDRVRAAALASMEGAGREALHREILFALRTTEHPDPEDLFEHARRAAMAQDAVRYASEAAERAARALAFARAAALYAAAAELSEDTREACRLRLELAECLADAGRGPESAEQFLLAVSEAPVGDRLELRRRAGEQYLFAGHMERGLEVLQDVLREVGLPRVGSRVRAVLELVALTLWMRVRPWRFRPRPEGEVPAAQLLQLDVARSAGEGLVPVRPIHGALFLIRHVLSAAKTREPFRVAVACMYYAIQLGFQGRSTAAQFERWMSRGEEAAVGLDEPRLDGIRAVARASSAFLRGEWSDAHEHFLQLEQIIARGVPVTRMMTAAGRHLRLEALGWLGRLAELRTEHQAILRDAVDRGDRYTATTLRGAKCNLAWLSKHGADRARAEAESIFQTWPRTGFELLHWYAHDALMVVSLYEGRPERGLALARDNFRLLRRSHADLIENVWAVARIQIAQCHAAAALDGGDVTHARAARQWVRRVERRAAPWAVAQVRVVRAALLAQDGQAAQAIVEMRRALEAYRKADMALHAAATSMQLGRLLGGASGAEMEAAGLAYMEQEGVLEPWRMARAFAPGFPEPGPSA